MDFEEKKGEGDDVKRSRSASVLSSDENTEKLIDEAELKQAKEDDWGMDSTQIITGV